MSLKKKASEHIIINKNNGNVNIYFTVRTKADKEYNVQYSRDRDVWSCDCISNTFFHVGEWCSHILRCHWEVENEQKRENTSQVENK